MSIDYHPAIERELTEARNYYEDKSPGLGKAFVEEFERQILQIVAMPGRWQIVERDTRRALMKRFPYVIYYRIMAVDAIRIIVMKHERRHPKYGRDRL